MQTLALDVNPEILVRDLKGIIETEMRIQSQLQQLYFKRFGKIELMMDDCSLSFY